MPEELIQAEPSIMMGKPVITGTRITVELILEKLAAGETVEQLLAAHPRLTQEAIQAAFGVCGAGATRGCRLSHAADWDMNFLADESVDQPIVERLRADGHDVLAVAEMAPRIPDDMVLAQANHRGDLLLTAG